VDHGRLAASAAMLAGVRQADVTVLAFKRLLALYLRSVLVVAGAAVAAEAHACLNPASCPLRAAAFAAATARRRGCTQF